MRDQATANLVAPGAGYLMSRSGRGMGHVDGLHGRTVANHAGERSHHAGSRIPESLALWQRYRGQAYVAATGVVGASALVILWIVNGGVG